MKPVSDVTQLVGERLRIEYVRVRDVMLWSDNPKEHDFGGIMNSIKTNDFRDPSAYDATLGGLVHGNGRAQALAMMERDKYIPPRGIAVDAEGAWYMPIVFGVDALSVAKAEQYAIDHNNLTLAGGDATAFDMLRMWDKDKYIQVLERLEQSGDMPITVDSDDLQAISKGLEDFLDDSDGEQSDKEDDELSPEELIELFDIKKGQVWIVEGANGVQHTFAVGELARIKRHVESSGGVWEYAFLCIGDVVDDVTAVVSMLRKALDMQDSPQIATVSLSLDLVKVADALGATMYGAHPDEGIFAMFVKTMKDSGYNVFNV